MKKTRRQKTVSSKPKEVDRSVGSQSEDAEDAVDARSAERLLEIEAVPEVSGDAEAIDSELAREEQSRREEHAPEERDPEELDRELGIERPPEEEVRSSAEILEDRDRLRR